MAAPSSLQVPHPHNARRLTVPRGPRRLTTTTAGQGRC